MTSTHPAHPALFLAPPTGENDDRQAAPRRGEEAMRLLRNPFGALDAGAGDTGHPGAAQ